MKKCGIYQIRNTVTGDIYIGQSVDIQERKTKHVRHLMQGIHDNRHLQNAWNKYGLVCFQFEIVLLCEEKDLTYYEQKFVDVLSPKYNICRICVNSCLGVKRSEETKQRLSESRKGINLGSHRSDVIKESISKKLIGRIISEETRKKLSMALTGIKRSAETIQKVRDSNIGNKHSEETKEKMSKSHRGENNHYFGKKHSQEVIEKMSKAQKERYKREKEVKNVDIQNPSPD